MAANLIRCPGCGVNMDLSVFALRPDQVVCPRCQTRSVVPPEARSFPVVAASYQQPVSGISMNVGNGSSTGNVGSVAATMLPTQVPVQAALQVPAQMSQPATRVTPASMPLAGNVQIMPAQPTGTQHVPGGVPVQQAPSQQYAVIQPALEPIKSLTVPASVSASAPVVATPVPPAVASAAPVSVASAPVVPVSATVSAVPAVPTPTPTPTPTRASAPAQTRAAFAPTSAPSSDFVSVPVSAAPSAESRTSLSEQRHASSSAPAVARMKQAERPADTQTPSATQTPTTTQTPSATHDKSDSTALDMSPFFSTQSHAPTKEDVFLLPIDEKGNTEPLAFAVIGLVSTLLCFPPLGLILCLLALSMNAEEKRNSLYNARRGLTKFFAILGIVANSALMVAEILLAVFLGMTPAVVLGYFL